MSILSKILVWLRKKQLKFKESLESLDSFEGSCALSFWLNELLVFFTDDENPFLSN